MPPMRILAGTDQLFRSKFAATADSQCESAVWYRVNVNTLKQPERNPRARTVGTLAGSRFQSDLLAAVDLRRKAQSNLPTRTEAVR